MGLCTFRIFLFSLILSCHGKLLAKMQTWIDEPPGECLSLPPKENLTHSALFSYLTHICHYDKLLRPPTLGGRPVEIAVRGYVYFLKASVTQNLQFKVQMLLQFSWVDMRLNYMNHSDYTVLIGEKRLLQGIWMPHVYLPNEKDSLVMGHIRKDDLIIILPQGNVLFTTRLTTSIDCKLHMGKFPFDMQACNLTIDTWQYNSSELVLTWEDGGKPWTREGQGSLAEFSLDVIDAISTEDQYYKASIGEAYNYSSLVITFHLSRQYGYYLIDYYVPSVLLVITSWVSFWLAPEAFSPRVTLGTVTMLTFILLNWNSLPKVSEFKANDVWFIGCTGFIFLSLAEFAFVNTIDRSGEEAVQIKKPTSKYILKSSLTPSPRLKPQRMVNRRTSSCPTSPEIKRHFDAKPNLQKRKAIEELKMTCLADGLKEALEKLAKEQETAKPEPKQETSSKDDCKGHKTRLSETKIFTMTPQEIAKWIDERSRIVFPVSYLIFNLFYWSFLWL